MIEKMFSSLARLYPLNEEIKECLTAVTVIKDYPKKSLLLQEGQTAHYAYFVLKGLARAYHITDGKEITTRFMDEGFIITSWLSFYTQKPGDEFIETMEDSILGCIHYDQIQKMYRDIAEFNIIGRKLAEYFFFLSEQRTKMLRKHTTEERYRFFLKQHPDLLQRIPLKYIATYLGMNEETLSRVRNKAARPKN
jgi:CRP/FNR family transcriptional regulator, anaerobic regulatory protein